MQQYPACSSQWRDLGGVQVRSLIVSRFRMGAPDGGEAQRGAVGPRASEPRRTTAGALRSKADAAGRVPLVVRALLVRSGGSLTLVDAGLGAGVEPEDAHRHRIADVEGDLLGALVRAGVAGEQIDRVVLTHLHLDHVGGLGRRRHGAYEPVLPDAPVYLQSRQWNAAREALAAGRGFRARDIRLLDRLDLRLLDGETEVVPGLRVRPTEGHSPGLQVVTVAGGREHLTYASDLLPTLAQVRGADSGGSDVDPARAAAERRELVQAAAARSGWLVFVHDPVSAAVRIRQATTGGVRVRRAEL